MIRILFILLLFSSTAFGQREFFALGKPATFVAFSYDADALDYITRWETTAGSAMPTADKNAFNTLVLGLKSNSLWTKFDTGDIAPFYGGTAATHAICIKGNNTLTFIASPTHSSTGTDWNGSTQYAQTGWIPSVSASASSVHIYYYSGEDAAAADRRSMGVLNASKWIDLRIQTTGGSTGGAYSTTIAALGANSNRSGGFLVNKESDIKLFLQRNGVTLATNTTSNTVTQPTIQLYIGAMNNAGTAISFDIKQCRYSSWGAGMTEAEATTYNTLVEALEDALGRGVQ